MVVTLNAISVLVREHGLQQSKYGGSMPWSQNNGNQNNPWGDGKKRPSGGNNQQPPDLDELMKRLQERFGGIFGGGGNGGGELSKGATMGLLAAGFVLWMISGFYVIAADEQGVVMRFGQYTSTTGPGMNWHAPFPIEKVEKIVVTRVQRLEVGFRDMGEGRVRKIGAESLMLTRDENIVDISFVVQYKIKSPEDYLFNIDSTHAVKTVRDAAEAAIREVIGRTNIDDVMTNKKAEAEVETEQLIQSTLDDYKSGITIVTVKLQDVQPPERVIKEFKDVASAREDKERAKNEAQTYANDIIPNARGEAKKRVLDAEAYEKEVIDRAKGQADRFNNLLMAYRESPEVTRKRLYLETMEGVLAKADKVIVDAAVAKNVLPYLPLGQAGKVEVK